MTNITIASPTRHTRATTNKTAPAVAATIDITGVVTRTFFCGETASAGKLEIEQKPDVSIDLTDPDACFSASFDTQIQIISYRAAFSTAPGERYTMRGSYVDDPKYGRQFHAATVVYNAALNVDGLAHFLATNPAFYGIGPVKAAKICAIAGDRFDEIIARNPAKLLAAGITPEELAILSHAWAELADNAALYTWLGSWGMTQHQMDSLITKYGAQTRAILEADPYRVTEMRGWAFARADEVALKIGVAKDHPGRLRACVVDVLQSEENDGHTWMTEDALLLATAKKLALDTLAQRDALIAAYHAAIAELILTRDSTAHVGLTALWIKEREIYDAINALLANPIPGGQANKIPGVVEYLAPSLTAGQLSALTVALTNRFAIITGEAGTGKSYVLNSLVAGLIELYGKGVDIRLAAPTGKAARRMQEAIAATTESISITNPITAATIHRLLGYSPQFDPPWGYNAENKLEADIVIIDEAGMLGAELGYRLLDAIDPARTRMVFIGDHQQLPPVDAGNVLRDLINSRMVPHIELTEVMRQAGVLKANSVGILRGFCAKTEPKREVAPGENPIIAPWYLLTHCVDTGDIQRNVVNIIENELPKFGYHDALSWQVITPQRNTAVGVNELNVLLQQLWQRVKYSRDIPTPDMLGANGAKKRVSSYAKFYPGDKIMQIKNDYDLGIMNGTIGIVVEVDTINPNRDGTPGDKETGNKNIKYITVQFAGEPTPTYIPADSDHLNALTLAYACTVHKYQGSEVPVCVVVCATAHTYMLSRNLLYTAVTRARESVVIVGESLAVTRALKNVDAMRRRTWLPVFFDEGAKWEGDVINENSIQDETQSCVPSASDPFADQ